MPRVSSFHGVRFDWCRIPLGRALCPPYDVIPEKMARRLRRLPNNTIHLELPAGGENRYLEAAKRWKRWLAEGLLIRDWIPSYYVIEQTFRLGQKELRRTGFIASLGLDEEGLRQVTPHERTLSKPKRDRWELLDAMQAQVSPIFALYEDDRGRVARTLRRIAAAPADAQGRAADGVFVRVWRTSESDVLKEIERSFASKRLLIADGHHRLEVSRGYGCRGVLCYLCAEQDPGLKVLPTHRVLAEPGETLSRLSGLCRLRTYPSLKSLQAAVEKQKSPFAFGVVALKPRAELPGRFALAVPSAASERGVRSGLGVEWLARKLLADPDKNAIRYTHEAQEAAALTRNGAIAFLIKPAEVAAIRRAVQRIGLLPQKSTYFFPKVEAGIVFQEI